MVKGLGKGKRSGGFTLLEILLSVSIISILVGLSVPVYESFVRRNDLDITTQTLANMLRRAEVYARGANSDSAWSVYVDPGTATITLFQGTVFSGHSTAYDETVTIPGTVTPTATTTAQFSRLTGMPVTSPITITLNSTTNSSRTVTVNAKGMVDYN